MLIFWQFFWINLAGLRRSPVLRAPRLMVAWWELKAWRTAHDGEGADFRRVSIAPGTVKGNSLLLKQIWHATRFQLLQLLQIGLARKEKEFFRG